MKSALTKYKGDDRKILLQVNHIAQQSKAEMDKIRTTPELEAAYVEAEAAYKEYYNARQETINVSNDIGAGDSLHPLATNVFAAAIKRVQEIDGEIRIFEPDDPCVTGKFSKTMP